MKLFFHYPFITLRGEVRSKILVYPPPTHCYFCLSVYHYIYKYNKLKNKKYNTVGIILKYNR
jgi:hypothetical protein